MEWMKWGVSDTTTLYHARKVPSGTQRHSVRRGNMDGICLVLPSGEIRYVIEAAAEITEWGDMIPAPEGMPLEDVKKLVEAIFRLKGAT